MNEQIKELLHFPWWARPPMKKVRKYEPITMTLFYDDVFWLSKVLDYEVLINPLNTTIYYDC